MLGKNKIAIILLIVIFSVPALAISGDPGSLMEMKHTKYTALDGAAKDFKDYKGKVVLVNFWASWCAPCIMEVPHLNSVYKRFHPKGFELLSLSVETQYGVTKIKNISVKAKMEYSLGKANMDTLNELNIFAIPTSMLFGKDGKLIRKFTGPPNPGVLEKDIEVALGK